jgi:hypothetical protein
MKMLSVLIASLLTLSVSATQVDGKLFYKLPSGDLAERSVTLEVPSRGQGKVTLSGPNFNWTTDKFKTVTKNGKTSFVAAFKTSFMNFKSVMIFKGTYIQANDKILYYGDFYKRDGHNNLDAQVTGAQFQGGFDFSYNR